MIEVKFFSDRAVDRKSLPMPGSSGMREIKDNNREATTRYFYYVGI
jgi:hypothetical protein